MLRHKGLVRSLLDWFERSRTVACHVSLQSSASRSLPIGVVTQGRTIQSWDIASTTGKNSDWSVCTTWRMHQRKYYLIDVWRERLEYPYLRLKVIELARKHSAQCILIEQAGLGLGLIQDMRANPTPGIPLPLGIQPEGDKLVRMEAQSARFETGQVYFPIEAPWLDMILHELLGFPNTRHDDQVDSVSQFLKWAESKHINSGTVSTCGPIVFRNGVRVMGSLPWEKDDDA